MSGEVRPPFWVHCSGALPSGFEKLHREILSFAKQLNVVNDRGGVVFVYQLHIALYLERMKQVIVIEPAQPQVVYVPMYNPTVVYGAWPYPSYPPYYIPPPPGYYVGNASIRPGDVDPPAPDERYLFVELE
jgi:hypothetical protein